MSESTSFGMLTVAHGKPRYLRMAQNLARSLKVNAPHIPRAVVTDAPAAMFEGFFDHIIPLNSVYGQNVEQKLHIDLYSPFDQTLFIDADSLVAADITPVFELFKGRHFSTDGYLPIVRGMDTRQWKIDLEVVLDHFDLDHLPKFNGGIYYFDRSDAATAVFDAAREMLTTYHTFGIDDFRACGPPDEILLSIAMARTGQNLYPSAPHFMHTLFGLIGGVTLDVLGGGSTFNKGGEKVSPIVLHFASYGIYHPVYLRECWRLRMTVDPSPLPVWCWKLGYPVAVGMVKIRWGLIQAARKVRTFIK